MKYSGVFIIAAFIIVTGALSCKKDAVTPPAATVSVDSLLIGKTWIIQNITYALSNKLWYYSLGGTANTVDLSKEKILFKKDSTASYTTATGSFSATWQFTDVAKTKLKFAILNYDKGVVKAGVNQIVYWENLFASTSMLRYAEIYTQSDNTTVVSSVTRIPM